MNESRDVPAVPVRARGGFVAIAPAARRSRAVARPRRPPASNANPSVQAPGPKPDATGGLSPREPFNSHSKCFQFNSHSRHIAPVSSWRF
ncbi:hypothetical protein DO70_2713 [Burkholderia pseudomallei]|nr:hypothetical protein DO70_2713 [Burkholderia pseudomallei]